MANSIGVVFTRVVEGVQSALEAIGNAISAGVGSVRQAVVRLFEGPEKSTIVTSQLSIEHYTSSKPENYFGTHRKIMDRLANTPETKQAKIDALKQNLAEWGDKIGMPGSKTIEESSEVAALLKPRSESTLKVTSGDKLTEKQVNFKQVVGYEFREAFGFDKKWKADAEKVRAEINLTLGKFFGLYHPEKVDIAKHQEIRDKLWVEASKIDDVRDGMPLKEQLTVLNQVKKNIEALIGEIEKGA